MDYQSLLESIFHKIIDEFLDDPYTFFTEADVVARLHQLLFEAPLFNRTFKTEDGHQVGMIHREYPTFFRFDGHNPTTRLGPPARRGHYDTVILNPDFIQAHKASIVANRQIKWISDSTITPFIAVAEFKFHDLGWSRVRAAGTMAEFGKLRLTEESPLRYMIVMTRYRAGNMKRWEKYWPIVKEKAIAHPDISSIFATGWLDPKRDPEKICFGSWLDSDCQ